MHWCIAAFKKYAVFSGRALRREYWCFVAFNVCVTFAIAFAAALVNLSDELAVALIYVYWGAAFLPGLAVAVRRLHDIEKSGWWGSIVLIPLVGPVVLLIFLIRKGTQGGNRFGPAPRPLPPTAVPGYGRVDPGSLSEPAVRAHRKACLRREMVVAKLALAEAQAVEKLAGQRVQTARGYLDEGSERLESLVSGRGDQLATLFGDATLYEYWIELPGYSGPVRGATARITRDGSIQQVSDVTGTTKGGLGGAVAGGLLLGPVGAIVGSNVTRKTTVETKVRQVDTRHSELEVIGPGFAWSTRTAGESDAMTRFRDLVNSRSIAADDVRLLVKQQADTVERLRQDMQALSAQQTDATSSTSRACDVYRRAQAEFRAARCSLSDRLQAWREGFRPVSVAAVASEPPQLLASAGWYADPDGRHQHRYWDGASWTAQVANDGVAGESPLM